MTPDQHPSTADWYETKHKSWRTTAVDLHTHIVELFTTLRIKHKQQAHYCKQQANCFRQQLYNVCRRIRHKQQWQRVEYCCSSQIQACTHLAEAIYTQQFWAEYKTFKNSLIAITFPYLIHTMTQKDGKGSYPNKKKRAAAQQNTECEQKAEWHLHLEVSAISPSGPSQICNLTLIQRNMSPYWMMNNHRLQ